MNALNAAYAGKFVQIIQWKREAASRHILQSIQICLTENGAHLAEYFMRLQNLSWGGVERFLE